jgi:thioesterase domain-containing protein
MTDLDRIVPLKPDGTAPPLFCVHAVSGSAYSYLELAQFLGADQPVYGIESPGFDDDREPVRSVTALSAEYAQTLQEFRPGGGFSLLGWSLGGIIAFDMAKRLTAAGVRVGPVILVDTSLPRVLELPPEKKITGRFLRELLATARIPLAPLDQVLAWQPDDASSEEIFLAAKLSTALPAQLETDLLAERYAVFRAHVEASYGFEVTEPYDGEVIHLIASESPPDWMRWDKVATNLTEHIVAGSHHSIWLGDGLLRLSELARSALASFD